MTIYLWHLTVVIVVTGLSLALGGFGLGTEPGTAAVIHLVGEVTDPLLDLHPELAELRVETGDVGRGPLQSEEQLGGDAHRLGAFFLAEGDGLFFGPQRLLDLLVLQLLEFQEHPAQVAFDLLGLDPQLTGGLFDEE